MSNINDYVLWRGDLLFSERDFNIIDSMILARFSYFPFHLIQMDEVETIKSIAQKMSVLKYADFAYNGDQDLIANLGRSKRFKNLKVTDYIYHFDSEATKQFSAISIHLNKKEMFLSYNGTDNSLTGWKEDFCMSFMPEIPSQIDALKYCNSMYKKYKKKMMLGGHSKGGNIAMYASIFVKESIQNKIEAVYNFDGPGFYDEVLNSKEYNRVVDRIYTLIPQDSVIGRLLYHNEDMHVVLSTEKGIYQHDIYSWQVLKDDIVKASGLTKNSDIMHTTINEYLQNTSAENRRIFIELAFQILDSSDCKTFKELSATWLTKLPTMFKTYTNLSEEDKKLMTSMLSLFVKTSIKIRTNKEE